jgi:hypothetical protein
MSGYKIARYSAAGVWVDILDIDNIVDLATYNLDQATQDGRLTDAEADILARVTTTTYDAGQGVQDSRITALEAASPSWVTTTTYTAGQSTQDGRIDAVELDVLDLDTAVSARVLTSTYNSGQATQDTAINASTTELNTRGVKAYAQRTSNSTSFSAATDLPSLTVTWTAQATRRYRISSWFKMSADNATQIIVTQITDGSNVVQLQVETDARSSGIAYSVPMELIQTGLSGSITRKVRALRFGGSGNINLVAAADAVAFIMVEDIGPA